MTRSGFERGVCTASYSVLQKRGMAGFTGATRQQQKPCSNGSGELQPLLKAGATHQSLGHLRKQEAGVSIKRPHKGGTRS